MRLSCLQENFNRGLSIVQRAVATRTTLPITQNVLIATDNSRVKLAATNLDIAISAWIGAQIEEEGTITIPARMLSEFVNSLPPERVDVVSEENGLDLACARFNAHINGQDPEDFPAIPSVTDGVIGRVSPDVLRDAINRVGFAAATEDSRPVLTGIKVEISGDAFTFAAADGFRLAVYEGKLLEPVADAESLEFIIPARALIEVNRLISGQSDPVEFTVTPQKSQAMFRMDNVELVSQLIQGTFPNYKQLVPENYETRAVVNQGAFLQATRTASIFARDGSGIVRINVSPDEDEQALGKMQVSSRAEELGNNVGELDARVEGGEAKIAFNSKYLTDVLDVLGDGEVAMETTSPSSPGVIKPAAEDEAYKYTHVVMPMFVQW